MSRIVVIRETSKLITISAVNSLHALNNQVEAITSDRADVANAFADDSLPDGIVIIADPELVKQQKNIAFLRQFVVQKEIPVFMTGYRADLELVEGMLAGAKIVGMFPKPFDLQTMCNAIDTYLRTHSADDRKRILLVDDSGQMLRRVQAILSGKYEVFLANSGAMALKKLSSESYDLVLLDYEMPIMNGKQVLEIIRADQDLCKIPVIFLTGKSDKQSIIDVMALKPEGYLLKSLSADGLIKAVDEFFGKRKKLN